MRKIKYLSTMLTFCILTLFIFMSSSNASSSLMETDHKVVVTKAYQKFLKLKNYHMAMDFTSSSYFQGKNVNSIIQSNCDIQVKPMIGKNTMIITMNLPSTKIEQQLVQYFEESGNQIIVYLNVNNQWIKQFMPYYNPIKEFDNYIKAITSVTLISEDSNSFIFEVVANGSYMSENIERYLASTNVQNIKLTADLLKNIGDFKYTIVVDKKTSAISRSNIDLSDLISKIGNKLAESQDTPDEEKKIIKDTLGNMKININVTFSELNKVDKITIPVAAKNATPNDLIQTKSSSNFLQSKAIGFVDVNRVIAESSVVKVLQSDLNQQGQALSDQLLIDRSNLTEEQFKQKQNAIYQEFLGFKKNLEKQINKSVEQAATLVVKEKKLDFVIYKTSGNEKIFTESTDITSDVIDRMQVLNK